MNEQSWRDLVGEVRRLADEIAPTDPDTASAAFDRLVRTYGRGPAAAALIAVAPREVAAMSGAADGAAIDALMPPTSGRS